MPSTSPIAQPLPGGRWRVRLPGHPHVLDVEAGSGAEAVYRARLLVRPAAGSSPASTNPDATVVDRLAGPELALFRGYGDASIGRPWLSQGGEPPRRLHLWDGSPTLVDAHAVGPADHTDFGENGAIEVEIAEATPSAAGPPRPPDVVQVVPGTQGTSPPVVPRGDAGGVWVRLACAVLILAAAALPWSPVAAMLGFLGGLAWPRAGATTRSSPAARRADSGSTR